MADRSREDLDRLCQRAIEISPGLEPMVRYIENIKNTGKGELPMLLAKATENDQAAERRLADIYLRTALRCAMNEHEEHGFDLDDAFSEACYVLLKAVRTKTQADPKIFGPTLNMAMRRAIQSKLSRSQEEKDWTDDNLEQMPILSEEQAYESIYRKDMAKNINNMLENGPLKHRERDKCILKLYFGFYGTSMTMEACGKLFNITAQQVSYIIQRALQKIRCQDPPIMPTQNIYRPTGGN